MTKLSVIIPIYNGEKFIRKCLDNFVVQNNGAIEVILIDDGSMDASAAICKEFAETYSWIKYFYKKNEGVSSARNLGLKKATGDYVWFVDIDDQIAESAIQAIFLTPTSELSIYGFSVVNGETEKIVHLYSENGCTNIADKDLFFKNFVFSYKLNNALWNKVFDLSIIKKYSVCFSEKIKIGEDFLFSLAYYKHIESVYFHSQDIYRYFIQEGSAMKSKNTSVFSYQQEIARSIKSLYAGTLGIATMQQFLLMQLVCGINQSKERGVDKKTLKQYKRNYMLEIMEGKRFPRTVVESFLVSEGAGILSRIKFKLSYFNFIDKAVK